MLLTILSLLGGGLGGVLRFIPEVLKLFSEGKDRAHELEMTRLQLEIDKARAAQNLDLAKVTGEETRATLEAHRGATISEADATAYIAAIEAQGKPSGVAWVDALNASVRPVLMYWWQILFTLVKFCTIWVALDNYSTMQVFIASIWTAEDAGILAMMLGFFFCDRTLRKYRGH